MQEEKDMQQERKERLKSLPKIDMHRLNLAMDNSSI